LIVAIHDQPISRRDCRRVFATIRSRSKEAAYGMGADGWEMIKGAGVPAQSRGLSCRQ